MAKLIGIVIAIHNDPAIDQSYMMPIMRFFDKDDHLSS
jgi:hypothetical protein